MTTEYINIIFYIMWGLLIFTSISFLLSGIDDAFIDIYYWIYYAWRYRYITPKIKLTYQTLATTPQKRIAIMVPCWHEAGVIEEMLSYNINVIEYQNYDFFIGVYANDPHTVQAVKQVADIYPNIQCVIGPEPGPTNKASNLNQVFSYIMAWEKQQHIHYDIFVMHDSEDIIHPYSLLLYNYLMPKNDMIQIPILPLEVSLSQLTHWTYNAEFSEIHTKDIVVREKIGGLVPSAGVGTAFSRKAINVLLEARGNVPFSTYSLTEDYSTALEIKLRGLRQIFVLQYINRTYWHKRWYFFGPIVPYRRSECIATRALFPSSYFKAVRQKTRWVLGIAFQEWIHTGWRGDLPTLYTLIHDRKSLFTHLITGLFFIQIPFWFAYLYFTADHPEFATLQDLFDMHPWIWSFITVSSIFMLNRFLQRAIAVYRVYGLAPAILSIPLVLYGNIINLHALVRAYYQFIFAPSSKSHSIVKWDKTDHTFPKADVLAMRKVKLGNLLLEHDILAKDQLIQALSIQAQTGEQLGDVVVRLGLISKKQLLHLLAKQYHMNIVKKSDVITLTREKIPKLSKANYHKIIRHHFYPIRLESDNLTIAMTDPSNNEKLLEAMKWAQPYKTTFVLIEQ